MKHYDGYGNPTEAHVRLENKSIALAEKVLTGRYISKITADFTQTDGSVKVTMELFGRAYRKRDGRNGFKVLPNNLSPTKNRELVEYMLDELEMEVGRRVSGWNDGAVRFERDGKNLHICDNFIRDVFYVKKD